MSRPPATTRRCAPNLSPEGLASRSATQYAATRVMLEKILVVEEQHANDMHDLLVAHQGQPMLEH